jgi:hypothetical protein
VSLVMFFCCCARPPRGAPRLLGHDIRSNRVLRTRVFLGRCILPNRWQVFRPCNLQNILRFMVDNCIHIVTIDYMPFIQFPFIEVPKDLLPIVGEPTPGTRAYRREGTFNECGQWFET